MRFDDAPGRGAITAQILRAAWRAAPPPLELSAHELAQQIYLLQNKGAGALAWWRLRNTALAPQAEELRHAYLTHAFQADIHEQQLSAVVAFLQKHGLTPLLLKGWAVSRLYPEPGLRPYGDLDLAFSRADFPKACSVIFDGAWQQAIGQSPGIDLHEEISDLADRSWSDIWSRTKLIPLGPVSVRVLGAEDQLRHLCLHFLRHGGWRPLWLCDIGAALEALPSDFDWDYFFTGDRKANDWVRACLSMAADLLGASLPASCAREPVAGWIRKSVLQQWGQTEAGDSHGRDDRPLRAYLRQPWKLIDAWRRRWPSAVEAVLATAGRPVEWVPRWARQWLFVAHRAGTWLFRTGKVRAVLPTQGGVTIHT